METFGLLQVKQNNKFMEISLHVNPEKNLIFWHLEVYVKNIHLETLAIIPYYRDIEFDDARHMFRKDEEITFSYIDKDGILSADERKELDEKIMKEILSESPIKVIESPVWEKEEYNENYKQYIINKNEQ